MKSGGGRCCCLDLEWIGVSEQVYLVVMVSVILAVTIASVPWLFRKRCPRCGAWAGLNATTCGKCAQAFPDEGSK